jgi:glyoxylase-like metal-dependent hydrolase (beta-lactamase superfamily II)
MSEAGMKFSSVMGNSQKLDGGAMFGNAPKALWTRWVQADDLNRIDLSCRALLVETGEQRILFETGIGAYMEPHLRDRYGVQESHHVLLDSLAALDLAHEDIDVVILSHLHFDHAGGLLQVWSEDQAATLLFPNATFYAGELAWQRAIEPHPRDRASFVPAINKLLEESGRLKLVTVDSELSFGDLRVGFYLSEGHTPGMLCSDLRWPSGRLIFAADLIPGRPWVHLPITMGYDRFPEQLINEKRTLLESVVADDAWLFFTHDHGCAAAKVGFDETKRKFSPKDIQPEWQQVEL